MNTNANPTNALIDWIGIKVYYTLPTEVSGLNFSSNDALNFQYDGTNLIMNANLGEELNNPQITIYDLLGQPKWKETIPPISKGKSSKTIPVNALSAGVYFVELTGVSEHFIKKIIVGY